MVDIHTVFPPIETSLAKRFPMFENILGTAHPIHECMVHVTDPATFRRMRFLIAYQRRPNCPPNAALRNLIPGCDVRGDIIVMRSGGTVLVQRMGGRTASLAAKLAVRK